MFEEHKRIQCSLTKREQEESVRRWRKEVGGAHIIWHLVRFKEASGVSSKHLGIRRDMVSFKRITLVYDKWTVIGCGGKQNKGWCRTVNQEFAKAFLDWGDGSLHWHDDGGGQVWDVLEVEKIGIFPMNRM